MVNTRSPVKLEKYYPPVIGRMREFQEIAKSRNPEFDLLWIAIKRFIADCYVYTATETGLARHEKELGLPVDDSYTIEERRSRILAALSRKLPFTMTSLREMLAVMVGSGNFTAEHNPRKQELTVLIAVQMERQMDDIKALLKVIVPANLVTKVDYKYATHKMLADYTHQQLAAYSHEYMRNELVR